MAGFSGSHPHQLFHESKRAGSEEKTIWEMQNMVLNLGGLVLCLFVMSIWICDNDYTVIFHV